MILPLRLALLMLVAASLCSAQTPLANLHPYPKTAFAVGGPFQLQPPGLIVVPSISGDMQMNLVSWLHRRITETVGTSMTVIEASRHDGAPAIFVARFGESPAFDAMMLERMPNGEPIPPAGGYVVDVTPQRVLLMGADIEGIGNAIATFMQLISPTREVQAAHIWDYPDYPVRWVFNMQNLRGANAIGNLRAILDTMSVLKLNAIQQNDF
ncbi:MAG: hypothetical protein H7X80_03135, partial [bacterium]|nr:hypothetical protein [Candidatus Kapabacteria bacterium]